jgi:hypothetical protein
MANGEQVEAQHIHHPHLGRDTERHKGTQSEGASASGYVAGNGQMAISSSELMK